MNLSLDFMVGAPPSSNASACYVQYVEWVKNAVRKSFAAAHEHSRKAAERQMRNNMISPFIHPMMIFKYMIGCGTFTHPGQSKSLNRDELDLSWSLKNSQMSFFEFRLPNLVRPKWCM